MTVPYHLLHLMIKNIIIFLSVEWFTDLKMWLVLVLSTRKLFISRSTSLYQCTSYHCNYGGLRIVIGIMWLAVQIIQCLWRPWSVLFLLYFLRKLCGKKKKKETLWTGNCSWESCFLELSVLELVYRKMFVFKCLHFFLYFSIF